MIWPLPIVGLLVLGITHGSVDHLLNPRISKLKFYCGYLFGLAFFLGLWFISPLLALLGFIILSGDHFGENQFLRALKISENQWKLRLLSFTWGLSVSLIAPLFHWNEAKPLLQTLLRDSQFGESLSDSSSALIGWILAALALASAGIISRYEKKALNRSLPGAISSLVLVLTFWALPLLPGFLTFFCFWHSWDSILQQKKSLGLTIKSYFLKAAPFSLLATLGLVGSVYFFDRIENMEAYLFLLLGALTVSHSVVMKRFYEF
jgi:Brp/Blh family beta-carotene 15,15'-monooxygenase